MNAGPPKRRGAGSGVSRTRPAGGGAEARPGAGAQRRRRRGRPDRARRWRVVLWVGVAVALAWVAVAMVVFVGGDEALPPPRPEEITAGAGGCVPRDFSVEPGESVVFRVTNTTDSDFEVIVTDEAGVALRTSPGYDPDDPVSPGAWGSIRPVSTDGSGRRPVLPELVAVDVQDALVASDGGGRRPVLLAAGLLAHDGHETEEGPNATADFRYRMIVAENGVRIMIVTFPEIGEFAPLTRILCAAIGPDGTLDATTPVGRITGG